MLAALLGNPLKPKKAKDLKLQKSTAKIHSVSGCITYDLGAFGVLRSTGRRSCIHAESARASGARDL